ncbi:MAG: enoyl-CoA hydratase-related protein [Microscillaceae bacterium]|jgi:2-(1,2-epoxy-1,2-dihydrophenyl)acetyl-CoA isomerase|nr:enoyl-CoA hydratase-related protein [Microscillaceae bacterium]
MEFATLLYQKNEGVLTITLNRPEVYNAVNNQLADDLTNAFKAAEADKEVRVIVLTGAGKAFCTGHDLKAPENMQGNPSSHAIYRNYFPLIPLMRNLPKPIICRLNGIAAGAGCSIALACDVIVAHEEAELCQIFINIALVPDAGSTYFLSRLVSRTQAFELMSKGLRLKAKEAQTMGIVNVAVPLEELDEALKAQTDYYANAPTKSIGMIKKMLNQSYHSDLLQMMEMEATYQDHAGKTQDHTEGIMAFIQKRKPQFKGK